MQKKIILLLLFTSFLELSSQNKYPNDYFENPLKIPLILSGTFGELRSNHFHAGLDIKTQGIEGLPIIAAADGYVSRINVALWGYGNALYITHPNGYTTVYAHLKKFSPEIEAYVKQQQYNKESFTVKLFPKKDALKITKGKTIALSGNSGSSGGPHLHYEIRDKNSKIINPFLFGVQVPDHKKPTIKSAYTYIENDSSYVNQTNKKVKLVFKKQENGDLLANKIYAYGAIGIGINAYDQLDNAPNKNGLYSLEMRVNGSEKFMFTLDRFSFSESRWINSYIDYKNYIDNKQRTQKCFINHDNNNLSLYKSVKNKGYVTIKDGLSYTITIIAKDFNGNTTKLTIPVQGKKDNLKFVKNQNKTPYYFKKNETNKITDKNILATFPKNIFYEDFYFDYTYKNGIVKLHNRNTPVHKPFKLYFDVSNYAKDSIKQMYIAKKDKRGRFQFVNTTYKDNKLYTRSKNLGEYTLKKDTIYPTIKANGFEDKQWLTNFKTLKVNIRDRETGIKSYRGEIDGKWILMAYNPKKGTLIYDFKDNKLEGTLHVLKIIVTDNVNNSTTFTTSFYRKNKNI